MTDVRFRGSTSTKTGPKERPKSLIALKSSVSKQKEILYVIVFAIIVIVAVFSLVHLGTFLWTLDFTSQSKNGYGEEEGRDGFLLRASSKILSPTHVGLNLKDDS